MTVRAVETPTEEPSVIVKLGDVNGDGVVNASAAVIVLIAAAAMGAGEASRAAHPRNGVRYYVRVRHQRGGLFHSLRKAC